MKYVKVMKINCFIYFSYILIESITIWNLQELKGMDVMCIIVLHWWTFPMKLTGSLALVVVWNMKLATYYLVG